MIRKIVKIALIFVVFSVFVILSISVITLVNDYFGLETSTQACQRLGYTDGEYTNFENGLPVFNGEPLKCWNKSEIKEIWDWKKND